MDRIKKSSRINLSKRGSPPDLRRYRYLKQDWWMEHTPDQLTPCIPELKCLPSDDPLAITFRRRREENDPSNSSSSEKEGPEKPIPPSSSPDSSTAPGLHSSQAPTLLVSRTTEADAPLSEMVAGSPG